MRAGVSVLVGPSRDELEELLAPADVVLDCMLGTGFRGEPRPPFDIWIECVNACSAHVLSVDVPSGLSAETGRAAGACVVADMTVTMISLKPGLLADDGRDASGAIVVAPLAEQTERLVIDEDPVAWRTDLVDYLGSIAPRTAAVDKFSRGSVLVVGGSRRYPGAAIMAARAAARMGVGYVTLATPASAAPVAQAHLLEIPVVPLPEDEDGTFTAQACDVVRKLAERSSAVLVGPGMRVSGGSAAIVSPCWNATCRWSSTPTASTAWRASPTAIFPSFPRSYVVTPRSCSRRIEGSSAGSWAVRARPRPRRSSTSLPPRGRSCGRTVARSSWSLPRARRRAA